MAGGSRVSDLFQKRYECVSEPLARVVLTSACNECLDFHKVPWVALSDALAVLEAGADEDLV